MSGLAPGPPLSSVTVASRSLILLFIEGASVGLAGWAIRSWSRLEPYVASNALTPVGRRYLLFSMGGGMAAALVAATGVFIWRRPRGLDHVYRLACRLAPLALIGLVPLLLNWRLWVNRDLSFLALTSLFGLGLQALVRFSRSARSTPAAPAAPAERASRLRDALQRKWSWIAARSRPLPLGLPLILACLGALAYAVTFSIFTNIHHYGFETSAADLGIENNLVWNAVHFGPLFKTSPVGGPTGSHLGFHQTYFAYVIGLVYVFVPRPETLLVVQAAILGAGAIPLFFLARRRLGPWLACLIAWLYLLYAPLQGSNLYDFHYLPFAPFFLWLTLNFIEGRRVRWAVLAVLLTLSVREDMSALLAMLGLILIVTDEHPKAGLVLVVVGAVFFVAVKIIIMPRFLGGAASYIHQYQDLLPAGEAGFAGVLKTILGNPGFTMGTLLEKDKLVYLLQIISPLAFLPWRHPLGWLCSVPGFFFTLLSTKYPPQIQISFQYTAYWTPFLFIAVIHNLARLNPAEERAAVSRRAWVVALTACVLITSHQYGVVMQHNTARGGFGPYRIQVTDYDRLQHRQFYELIALMPPRAKVSAGEVLNPHVSSRPDAYTLRNGIYDAEYLVFTAPARGDEVAPLRHALESGTFGVVDQRGRFVLARRGHPKDRNAEVLKALGP